jgi:5'-deoxynucleotidase YfbR-like HD superfamily hydrolase
MSNYKNITNLLFEIGNANNIKNAGWELIRADSIPSLSEHSYRCAILAFIIAVLEKMKDPYKIAFKALINKTYKIRLCDRHKVSANYFDYPRDIEDEVRKDQFKLLGDKFTKIIIELDNLSDKEKIIIKDADQLELSLEAREYSI